MIDGGIVRPASRIEGDLDELTPAEAYELNDLARTTVLPDVQVMVSVGFDSRVVVRTRPVIPVITSLNELG